MLKLKVAAFVGLAMTGLAVGAAMAGDRSDFDGVYVGRPNVDGTPCSANRDFSVNVEDGQARLLYNRNSGLMLTGRVSSRGEVVMTGDAGITQIKFVGQIEGSQLVGHSDSFGAVTCTVQYKMTKQ